MLTHLAVCTLHGAVSNILLSLTRLHFLGLAFLFDANTETPICTQAINDGYQCKIN